MSSASSPRRSQADRPPPGSTAWRVRPARATDWNAIVALQRELEGMHARLQPRFFRAGDEREPPPLPETTGEAMLVACDPAGRVRGLVRVQLYDTPRTPAMVAARRAHVEELVVAKAWRRRGCGRALADAAAVWAREHGAQEILLTVWEGNDAATRFYEQLGWRQVSRVLAKKT
jgi:ribosomal protein S18 acetylase RimI-like enzyme